MKKFEGILICTDLDGTLLNNERTVSKENREAIDYFKSEGGYFTFITGRMPYFSAQIFDMVLPNAPFGCINGGGIYDMLSQKYLYTRSLSFSVLDLVKETAERIDGIGIQVNHFDKLYFCKDNEAMAHFIEITGVPHLTRSLDEINEPIAKIIFGTTSEETMQALERFLRTHPRADEFDFIRSEQTLFEILPKGTNKGILLPHFEKILGVKKENIIAIGDYHNDIGMLRAAGLGVAVANAVPEAKAAADLVTVSNDEHAIASIIGGLDSGRICLSTVPKTLD